MPKYQGKEVVLVGPLPMEDERHGGHPVENELVIIEHADGAPEKIVFANEVVADDPPV